MTNSQKLINMDLNTLIEQTRARDANPGGGAILILMSNLAVNLMLMMDKNNFGNLENQAKVSRETILKISDSLKEYMQADVDNFNQLMDAIKNESASSKNYENAANPLLNMLDCNLKAMDILDFYLNHGKISTLTDGEIANEILKTASLSAIPTIEYNLKAIDRDMDYELIRNNINNLYEKNKITIERRKK